MNLKEKMIEINGRPFADIYDYRTGEGIRKCTEEEALRYTELIADDNTGTGAVDGSEFGIDATIYMD